MNKETLFEMYDSLMADDLNSKYKYLDRLTNALLIISNSLYEEKVQLKYHQSEIEGKIFRFAMANHSILNLSKGNNVKILDRPAQLTDIFSIYSIARMQIESFTIMYYLFFDEVPEEELDLRYSIYKLHGLQKQAKFIPSSEYGKNKLKEINIEIENEQLKIKESSLYQKKPEKNKYVLLNPKYAKLISTEDIMTNAGMMKIKFRDMWSVYSNHLHSEHLGDRQYNSMYKKNHSVDSSLSTVFNLTNILTAKLTDLVIKGFIPAKNKFQTLSSEDQTYIKIWQGLINK